MAAYSGSNNDYLMVTLRFEGKDHHSLVHRLVAQTWIENPNNLSEIDHIDNNPRNNKMENLRWCDRQFNISRQTIDKGALNGLRSHTKLFNQEGDLMGEFPSMTAACQYAYDNFGCSKTGMMKYHNSKGHYIIADNEERRRQQGMKATAEWDLYDPEDDFIGTFSSKREAARFIKENIRDISVKLFSDCGKAYGFYVIQKSVETK